MDKVLALVGAAATGFSLSDVSTGVGIAVGITTVFMLIPRALINWSEWKEKAKSKDE